MGHCRPLFVFSKEFYRIKTKKLQSLARFKLRFLEFQASILTITVSILELLVCSNSRYQWTWQMRFGFPRSTSATASLKHNLRLMDLPPLRS